MIRVVWFLIIVGLVALGAGWLADRPGGVEIVWLGYRVSTSVAVLVAVLVLAFAALTIAWSVLRAAFGAPGRVVRSLRLRRALKGRRAITRGLIAVGAGDARAARRHAEEAKRLAAHEPLTLLLAAQSAALAGDHGGAESAFRAMAARGDLKAIGLHGLFVEARKRGDAGAARALAEEAAGAQPSLAWAALAVLEFRCAAGDWAGALDALERNRANRLIDKPAYHRQRAVLLTAQAQALADSDRDAAKAMAVEAAGLAPGLVPAAALAGRFHSDAGDRRRASKVLDAAWRLSPHPDIADAYIHLIPGDSARERLARARKLDARQTGHIESALALARAAIEAQEFGEARHALEPFLAAPTQRVALLMAELEEAETGDVGRARGWMARAVHAARDPAWTADGFVSETWQPVSPATGRLDAFEWKVPVAELPGRVVEDTTVPEPPAPADPPVIAAAPREPEIEKPAEKAIETAAETPPEPPPAPPVPAPARPAADPVIPLIHAPDDPGPDGGDDAGPGLPTRGPARWRRLFG